MLRSARQCVRIIASSSKAFVAAPRQLSSGVFGRPALEVSKIVSLAPSSHTQFLSVRSFAAKAQLTKKEAEERVIKMCSNFEKIAKDKLTLEANFMNDLGLDSLDHTELVMSIEDEFGYEVPDADAETLITPSEIVKYVLKQQSKA